MRIVRAEDGSEWVHQKCSYCDTWFKYLRRSKNVGCPTCHAVYNRTLQDEPNNEDRSK